MPITSAALAAEITNDPAQLGYKNADSSWKADSEIAGLLNAPKADTTPWPDALASSIRRTDVTPQEILEAIDIRDLSFPGTGTLPAAAQPLATAWLESATQQQRLRLQTDAAVDTTVLKNLRLMLVAAGQGSTARVNALATRAGSRAESLWGRDTRVTDLQVAQANGRG
jgi:hypothetical protein